MGRASKLRALAALLLFLAPCLHAAPGPEPKAALLLQVNFSAKPEIPKPEFRFLPRGRQPSLEQEFKSAVPRDLRFLTGIGSGKFHLSVEPGETSVARFPAMAKSVTMTTIDLHIRF